MITTRWWWVRHAPVTVNNGRMYGASDPPADLDDADSFAALAQVLPADAVWVTSHLQRARDTAATIRANGLNGHEPVIEPAFGEQNFGAWQGQRYDDLRTLPGKPPHRFWFTTSGHCPPDGESFDAVMGRVTGAIDRLTEAYRGRDVVAVAHGGPIRAAVAHALGLVPDRALGFVTDNLSVTRLDHVESPEPGPPWQVHYVNRAPRWIP
jgi:alpha-ribazole phosphatase